MTDVAEEASGDVQERVGKAKDKVGNAAERPRRSHQEVAVVE